VRIRSYRVRTLIGALALAATGIASATDISGAGATFPYPVYSKWAEAYKAQTGVGLNYQSIGSGGGIKQIKAATVTFGASDKPLESQGPERLRAGAMADGHWRRGAGGEYSGCQAGRSADRRPDTGERISR